MQVNFYYVRLFGLKAILTHAEEKKETDSDM